jgi:glycosyltransferase involved in cell wall biosynthesis
LTLAALRGYPGAVSEAPAAPRPIEVLMGVPQRGLPGGPQGHIPLLVAGLRALGANVAEEIYGSSVPGQTLPRRVLVVLNTARRLRQALRAHPFDVVHLNTAFDFKALLRDLVCAWTARRSSTAIVFLKFHGSEIGLLATSNPVLRVMNRALFRAADGLGVLSEEERGNFLRAGVDAGKVFVVKNILDPSLYAPDPGLRAELGVGAATPVLLFASRFLATKGLQDVVRACGLLRDRGEDFVLVCLGDGPERGPAAAVVERLGLGERVHFLGQIPEAATRRYYASATTLVFPTFHQEGFPMTVFQAVAAGTPVVTTRIRAAADYLREPDNCLWVERRDPADLAAKVQRLLHDASTRERMARCNRELAQRFGRDVVAREFLAHYAALRQRRAR